MSKEKAKEFLEHLKNNPELMEKMKGFTGEEFKEAVEELKTEGKFQKEGIELIPWGLFIS